jgi:PAS domain S-box-containing protein
MLFLPSVHPAIVNAVQLGLSRVVFRTPKNGDCTQINESSGGPSRLLRHRSMDRWGLALVLSLLLSLPLQALDSAKSVFQFNVHGWSRVSGLPADRVNSIAQTKDGFIWLGTRSGLVRFDGQEFTVTSAESVARDSQEVINLHPAKNGGIWYALNSGRVGRFDGRKYLAIEDGPRQQRSFEGSTVIEAADGTLWIGSDSGLRKWSGGNLTTAVPDSIALGSVLALAEDASKRLWIGTANRGLFTWADGKLAQVVDDMSANIRVSAIAIDRDGQIWAGTENGLRCFDHDGRSKNIVPVEGEITALLMDHNGDIWAGTSGSGLARYQKGAVTSLRKVDGLGSDHITCLFEDIEGSVWVGTRDGLNQITDLKFPIIGEKEGLTGGGTHTVAPANQGGVWISTNNGFSHADGNIIQNFADAALFSNIYVKTVFQTSEGLLYVVGGDKTINVYSGKKRLYQILNVDWPESFTEDSEGVIAGIGPNLVRINNGTITPFAYANGQNPPYNWIIHLAVASDGAVWAGTANGVFRVKDGLFQHWTTAQGLSGGLANFVVPEPDGTTWVGLPTGLARIKGSKVKNITEENGFPDPRVYAIVPDDHGYFWISTGRGIYRISRDSLNACADGKAVKVTGELFEGLDAIKSNDRADQGFSGCKTADGRIWLPSPRGVIMIEPAAYTKNSIPPQVSIQELRQNGQIRSDHSNLNLHIGDTLEFSFAALSYVSPKKLQVRYRLEGFDTEWLEAAGRRTVVYRNLQGGTYKFEVQAGNADGVWTTEGAQLGFVLRPPFYRTSWFFAVAGTTVLLALIAGYRWKVRRFRQLQARLQAQNELLERRIAERTRELAHEHELLRALLDNSPDRIYFKDTESRYLKASQAQAERYGLKSAAELVGTTDSNHVGEENARTARDEEQTIIRTGVALIGKIEKEEHSNGGEEWLLTSKMPYRNPGGEIIGTFGLSKNITAIKDAEKKVNEIHRQLLETSRRAGMSEVATSVLHNVGNVLNSVNVSATIAVEAIRDSKITLIPKLSKLLEQHSTDLATFFTSDPKGQILPGFLASLGQELLEEQEKTLRELNHLTVNIEQIKEIVALQQSFTRVSGIAELTAVSSIVDDALRMHQNASPMPRAELLREFGDPMKQIVIERPKVIEILINLIRNAEAACEESGRPDKRIIVRTSNTETGVRIAVADNGVGIASENLTLVFSLGFTTQTKINGYALHSAALAAGELGGVVTVESAGLDQGATFFVDLPENRPGVRANAGCSSIAPLLAHHASVGASFNTM